MSAEANMNNNMDHKVPKVEEISLSASSTDEEENNNRATTKTEGGDSDSGNREHDSRLRRAARSLLYFYHANEFPVLVLLAIGLAKAYPPLGAEYLKPQYTGK